MVPVVSPSTVKDCFGEHTDLGAMLPEPREGPENPNQLKTLTLAPALVTLERWMVSYRFTTQNKVADHATRRLCASRIHLHLVPITPLHADGTHRLAPSSRSL